MVVKCPTYNFVLFLSVQTLPHIVLGSLGKGQGKYTPCQLGLYRTFTRKQTPLCKIRKPKELFEDYQPVTRKLPIFFLNISNKYQCIS